MCFAPFSKWLVAGASSTDISMEAPKLHPINGPCSTPTNPFALPHPDLPSHQHRARIPSSNPFRRAIFEFCMPPQPSYRTGSKVYIVISNWYIGHTPQPPVLSVGYLPVSGIECASGNLFNGRTWTESCFLCSLRNQVGTDRSGLYSPARTFARCPTIERSIASLISCIVLAVTHHGSAAPSETEPRER